MLEDITGECTFDTLSFPHFYKSDYVYHSCIQFIVLPPEKILVRVSIRMGKVYKIQNLWCFIIFIDECKTRFLKCSFFCIKIRDVTRICFVMFRSFKIIELCNCFLQSLSQNIYITGTIFRSSLNSPLSCENSRKF